ncbi:MAG TPA: hypothetical protein VHA75_16365 [Rugosimonospora sp.]|nr:hypothetical protein [Rugosimonospora sp.]
MRRVWTWLLNRPEPRQPARRIVTLAWIVAAVAAAAAVNRIPPEPALRVLDVLIPATIAVGVLVVVLVVVCGRRSRR